MHPANNQSGLNRIRPAMILFVSVCVNLVLAGAALRLVTRPTPPSKALSPRPAMTVASPRIAAVEPPAAPRFVTNRFNWRQIESADFEEYTANLRAIGCPEKTVRDIILADVNKYYKSRQRALNMNQPFWAAGKQRRLVQRKEAAETTALKDEQEALIKRLLGIEWFDDHDNPFSGSHFEEQALVRFIFGPMPEDSFQRAVQLFEKYDSLKTEFQRRTQGITTVEDDAEMRRLGDAMEQELATILTPLQIEELKARAASLDLFGNDVLAEVVALTPTEARQIALARGGDNGPFKIFNWSDSATEADRELQESQFTNAVANLLGEQRFADYQRAQDGEFRSLFQLSKANNLPEASAVAVYDIRKLAKEEATRIRTDAALDDSARQQRFEEMQNEIQQAVSASLGDKVYQEYLRSNGSWITNLTKL
jgi:hypothetical protein